ncbi:PfsNACHT and ankyrin domain protein [Penicillium diatomitis]|uniref:PfsNACHT and ankyrin domain protein n=1 Tax=Penicillium diatomitis TaxID=2819901 RepID=A0A9X0BLX2_9EURO|nr:PfsNACHT and ankyrin domain protein [Penicillium diatomitis]KAJ5472059.1 PfsNACHT and ankyrin domain protein [Penicillium diatomitis]
MMACPPTKRYMELPHCPNQGTVENPMSNGVRFSSHSQFNNGSKTHQHLMSYVPPQTPGGMDSRAAESPVQRLVKPGSSITTMDLGPARSVSLSGSSSPARAAKSDGLQSCLCQLSRQSIWRALVPSAVDAEDPAKAIVEKVQQQIDCVQQITVATKATTDSIKSELRTDNIKSWLDPPDPSTIANHAKELHHEGTGAWLLEDPIFWSWYSGSCRHMWLYRLAGSGKTILSITVLDHLAMGNNGPILKFFFDFSNTKKQTYESMLRSLIFQLYDLPFIFMRYFKCIRIGKANLR